jgi:PEP-CTERM/exosortase A-associated glycosyltransferase
VKILHVLDHSIPLHSGYAFRTRAILREQRALGWQTAHLTSAKHYGTTAAEEHVDGLHFYRTPPAAGPLARLPVVAQWTVVRGLDRRLEEVIARERPDLLHAHSPSLNGLAALRAGRRQGLPVVYECRAFWEDAATDHGTSRQGGPRYRLTRAVETHVFRRADAVTTICEGLRADIVSRGVPSERVTVIPNAVDVERFGTTRQPDLELARALGLEGHSVVGFIGSFYAYEGLELLLEALPTVLRSRPRVRLLLVGGGPQDTALRARAERLGLGAAAVFTGRVPHEHVDRYYDLVDVFVYPRLPMRLTELVTPLKPLEALAHGRVVVASDVGGHRELLRHGETGWLFRAGDPRVLADALVEVLGRREEWPAWGDRGRAFVERERAWPVSVARYRPVYDRLVARAADLDPAAGVGRSLPRP